MIITRIAFVSACAILLLAGCDRDSHTPDPDRPYVIMNGSLKTVAKDDTRAVVIPGPDGIPGVQLPVGIMTVNYATTDPLIDRPDEDAWMGASANLSRGYFGGGLNASGNPTNGEINYTNETGTAVRRLFYDEGGEYYFTRVCYPYVKNSADLTPIASLNRTPLGTEVVFSGLDGSQDVMVSNLAWGNVNNPVMQTDATGGIVVMSHLFSLFRVKVRAENATAAEQFGQIEDAVLKFQPTSVGVNMLNLDLSLSAELTDYRTTQPVILPPTPLPIVGDGDDDFRDAGYVMAPPAVQFRFEVLTSGHGWVQGFVDTSGSAAGMSQPGYSYDVILTFMESYEVVVEVQEPREYWFDWVFD